MDEHTFGSRSGQPEASWPETNLLVSDRSVVGCGCLWLVLVVGCRCWFVVVGCGCCRRSCYISFDAGGGGHGYEPCLHY